MSGDGCAPVAASERDVNDIQQSFAHLTRSMRALGILYTPHDYRRGNRGRCGALEISSKLFHALGAVIVWLNFVRVFYTYDSDLFGPKLVLKLIVHASYLKTAAAHSTCTYISHNWMKIFAEWRQYRARHCVTDDVIRRTWRRAFVAVLLVWGFHVAIFLLNVAYVTLDNHMLISSQAQSLEPLPSWGLHVTKPVLLIGALFDCFIIIGMTFVLAFVLCICLALRDEFDAFNAYFENAVEAKCDPESAFLNQSNSVNFEFYRQWHLNITKILNMCDDTFSFYVLLVFVCDVALTCGALYLSAFQDADLATLLSNLVPWLVYLLTPMLLIITMGTKLHSSVSYVMVSLVGN